MKSRELGPHLNIAPVSQRGRQLQHKAALRQAGEAGRKHSSSFSESCCGFQVESSRDVPAVLNCKTPEAKVTTPKASRQDTGPCCNALSSDHCLAKSLLKEEEVCLDPSRPRPKKATWQPLAAAPLLSMSPTTDPSTSAMRSELLQKAQAARIAALQKAAIAAKLVAKAQHMARIAKADAGARLELQRSLSAAASSFHRGGTHQKSPSRTASVSQPHAASTKRVHSKTRAGAAAFATLQAAQALSAGDDIPDTQQQQQQQQQPLPPWMSALWMSALPKENSSECSTMFSGLRHAHAGTKRPQEAACLPTADARQAPFKSRRVDFVLPSSPAQVGSCNRGHAFTSPAADAAKAHVSGLHASQAPNVCQAPVLECSPPCSSGTMDPDCQHGSSCHLQGAHCQQSCRPSVHAHVHRHSSSLACGWAGTGADVSQMNSDSSGSITLPAYFRSAPWVEEDAHHSAGLLLSGPCHAQQPSADPGTSASAAALRQQHQLHMIDLMLARVSAAQEVIQLGLVQPHQPGLHCKEQSELWVPDESCNKLVIKVESSIPVEDNFCGMESLLLCRQQAECNKQQIPVMGDCESKSSIQGASSVYRDTPDDMLEECSERTHSSSGSSLDCPGLSFVPNDWLIDNNDEVDLGFFSTVPSDDVMLGMQLMPPSLQT